MKRRLTAFLTAAIFVLSAFSVSIPVFGQSSTSVTYVNEKLPEEGDEVYGFKVTDRGYYKAANGETVTFKHIKSGATLVYIKNDDKNLAFNISYKTPQTDETDRNHVFEHAILASSEKYPSSDVFFDVYNKTYNTYVNASTMLTVTNYMVSSMSSEQLEKMIDVYLSCMVAPGIAENENFFKREALNYTLESCEENIELGGTVFSEDMGYLTNMGFNSMNSVLDALYPNETASNMLGRSVENYKELTYEHTVELYNMCYHFDNSIITLYGDLDYKKFLKFIDEEYLSKYENNNTDLSEYEDEKTPEKYTDTVVYSPAYSEDTAVDASVISYAVDLDGYEYEDILKLTYLAAMLNSGGSPLERKLKEAGINNAFNCNVNMEGSKPYICFELYNTNEDVKKQFENVVKETLKEVSQKGLGEEYENTLTSSEITENLSKEDYDFGINSALTLSVYWAATGKTDIYDLDTEVFNELKADKTMSEVKRLAGSLLDPENSALVATVPKPGLADEIDSEREEYLSQMKEKMSEEEINALVKETEEYNKWSNESISNDNVSISPQQLPEPEDLENVSVTKSGEVTNYYAEAGNGIGSYSLIFDGGTISKEDLYYLYIYNILLTNVKTNKYTSDEISKLMPVYLNNFNIGMSYYKTKEQEEPTPKISVSWFSRDEDYEKSLELALNIMGESDFSDVDEIIATLEYYLPYCNPAKTSDTMGFVSNAALSGISENAAFYMYLESNEVYELINDILNKLYNNEGYEKELANKLNEIMKQVVHKDDVMTAVVCAGESENKVIGINNKLLNRLPELNKEKAEYSFDKPEKKEAYIAEVSNQTSYNVLPFDESFKGEYIPFVSMISDLYTIPTARFKNGVYSAGTSFAVSTDASYVYSYTYSDPNVGKTVDMYENTVKAFEGTEITQEELDDYIVAAYSGFVVPQGDYSRAKTAINYEVLGIDRDLNKKYADGIKNAKAEDMEDALECIQKMLDNGYIAFIGNSTSVENEKDIFDAVTDLR